MRVAAGVAAGLLWGGPAVLIVLKPTFAPLALVGFGRRWLAAPGWQFAFAGSYPHGKEAFPGYEYEPWHIRYIGRRHAAAWHASGLTLIEYLRTVRAAGG